MAATTIATQAAPSRYSQTGSALTFTAADDANGNNAAISGNVILLASNTGASAYTVTITSVADPTYGRTGDVSAQSLAAGEIRMFRLEPQTWSSSGYVAFSASNAAVEFAVITE